jgi:ABC-type sulfate transport system substrate-binding protein
MTDLYYNEYGNTLYRMKRMKNKIALLAILITAFVLFSTQSYAGKINNLNINASSDSKVEVHTGKNSEIENVKIKKEPGSSVKINNEEINCEDKVDSEGFCSPDL